MISIDYLNALNHRVTEVRIFCKDRYALENRAYTGNICFGYYENKHYGKMIEDLERFDKSNDIEGIYTTIQECDPALLARANNRIKLNAKSGETTSDNNIKNYTIFPIDIDPVRPAKVSSSNEELAAAKNAARLVTRMFPDFKMIKALSGNGYHILIPINPLEVNDENTERMKRLGDIICLDIINEIEGVEGDVKIYNPARIFKLYGTMVRKGDSTETRPHRRSVVKMPDEIIRYDIEQIEEVLLRYEDQKRLEIPVQEKHYQEIKDMSINKEKTYKSLEEFLNLNNIPYISKKSKSHGIVFEMICPFDESHGKDSYATHLNNGKWSWRCFHNGCDGKDWHDFRDKVAPNLNKRSHAKREAISRGYVEENTHKIIDIDVEIEVPPDKLIFPKDELMDDGLFWLIDQACQSRPDLAPEFLHAAIMNNIGAILGRRIYLVDDPVVWPNMYHIIIGETGFAQKTTVTKIASAIMKMADELVLRQTALATAEGLINLFVFPKGLYPGCEIPEGYAAEFNERASKDRKGIGRFFEIFEGRLEDMIGQTDPQEGFRMQLIQNELASLLAKSRKFSSIGLTQTITEFYDMEDMITSPTKSAPTVAHYPCLSILASSTKAWVEKEIVVEDIHAGFINRFAFYVCGDVDVSKKRMFSAPIDKGFITQIAKGLNELRAVRYPKVTPFTISDDAKEYSEEWHSKVIESVSKIKNEIVKDAISRFSLHCKKFALLYAVNDNMLGDNVVSLKSMRKAVILTNYHIAAAKFLFGEFTVNEEQRIEDLVFKKIREAGKLGMTPRQVAGTIRRASTAQVEKAIDVLSRFNFIASTPIPFNKGKYRWHAVKNINLIEVEKKVAELEKEKEAQKNKK